ncbi:SMC-Scp complex subunit ScpB [Micavibrio aeruginosavorus]|uniref:Segregation and condensation protein B n=1 Tax=Micavibrio aeruginosavorus (strain ARL-13) TaxID=856793 RepID=G2KP68_MICAA|nr:SMC-Scp complex subunit ScpB [Micavibrio aeruginosavorus]AEP08969.1 segregation and condensation protein B [Micavibrio aeruginosavorus ARL-13]
MSMDDNDSKEMISDNTMASVAEIMAEIMDGAMDEDDAEDMEAIEDIAEAVEADLSAGEEIEEDDFESEDEFSEDEVLASDAEDDAVVADAVEGEVEEESGPLDTIRILEALLFASPAPLSMSAMRERLPEDSDVGGMLMKLKEEYATRGVHLMEMDGHWAFRTADDLNDALLLKREVRRPLSRAAMETLAIVAYHQPVTRAEIENIRGVVIAKGTLDILMECGWVKPGRRRETPGRPLTWVTTASFLDHFGLETLSELPGLDDLKASGLLDRRPAIENIAPDLFDQIEENDAKSLSEDDEDDEETAGGFEAHFNEEDAVAPETEEEADAELSAMIDDMEEEGAEPVEAAASSDDDEDDDSDEESDSDEEDDEDDADDSDDDEDGYDDDEEDEDEE